MEYKRFRVPNRDVKLTEEFEVAVACTRPFQRLFYLKQLGLAHLVYPCATHTRAGHSIECLDEASKLLDSIGIHEGDDGWREVRMAALLHDIGHIPFSHTLEDENEVLPKHDKGERLERILGNLKKEVNTEVGSLIDKATPILLAISAEDEAQKDWRSDLVGNTVCADLLAYITTDAAWTGIEKRPGYYRIYDYFKTEEKSLPGGLRQERLCIRLTKGGLRMDVVSAILDLLDMRYALTERVIVHHAKAMASAMLARACRLCGLEDAPILSDMGDERFLDYLGKRANECKNQSAGDGAKVLLEQLRSRRLYKRIFKVQRQAMLEWDRNKSQNDDDLFCTRWRNGPRVEEMLSKVEDRFNLPRGTLVLWCPEGRSGMKLVDVNVVWDQPGGIHPPVKLRSEEVHRQFPAVHDRVETIENQYLGLWTFWIGIHPEHIRKAPGVIAALSSEIGIECDPVFVETYAKTRLEGFAESAELQATLEDTWQTELMPEVSQKILDVAARPGGEVDSSVVTETIHAVSDQKRQTMKRTEKRGTSKQPRLPGVDEKGDVVK
jgi:HD superfamily phosphohydrolase